MASIRKRGVNQWQAQIIKKGFPPKYRTFDTKAEAIQWARQIESEMDQGLFVDWQQAQNTTLSEILDRYATERIPLLSPTSRKAEISRVRLLNSLLGKFAISAISASIVSSFRDKRLKTGLSAQSVIHELSLLHRILKTAEIDWGIAIPAGLPTSKIRRPKTSASRNRRLENGELEKILAATKSFKVKQVILFALETAMRRSEIANMDWADIDWQKRLLVIPKTKNGEARTIPLSTKAVEILESLKIRSEGSVFLMQPDSISQAFERACKRQEILDLHFHDLRHEATSRLFEKGLMDMQVSLITGHKTLQMLKRYTHLRAEDLVEIIG